MSGHAKAPLRMNIVTLRVANGLLQFCPDTVNAKTPLWMGFTFSFPIRQTAINKGKLLQACARGRVSVRSSTAYERCTIDVRRMLLCAIRSGPKDSTPRAASART